MCDSKPHTGPFWQQHNLSRIAPRVDWNCAGLWGFLQLDFPQRDAAGGEVRGWLCLPTLCCRGRRCLKSARQVDLRTSCDWEAAAATSFSFLPDLDFADFPRHFEQLLNASAPPQPPPPPHSSSSSSALTILQPVEGLRRISPKLTDDPVKRPLKDSVSSVTQYVLNFFGSFLLFFRGLTSTV